MTTVWSRIIVAVKHTDGALQQACFAQSAGPLSATRHPCSIQVMYLAYLAWLKYLLTVCTVISYAYAAATLAEHLQARKGSKREWLDAFPEGLVLNRQQGNVALNANGQHLSNELLIISSSLHLHLYGRQTVHAPESDGAKLSEQSEATQLHTLQSLPCHTCACFRASYLQRQAVRTGWLK